MKTKKYHQLTLLLAFLSTTTVATADTFSYTSISAEYQIFNSDVDDISEDLEGSGIVLNFSLNITSNFAIIGGYGTGSADVTFGGTTVDADINIGGIGALFHTPINQTTDFVAGIELIRNTVDLKVNGTSLPSEDADGNSIFVGIRSMVADKVELNGSLGRTKIEDDSSTRISFGALYYIDKLFTLDAGYSFHSDGSTVSFGATKYF